MTVGKLDSGSTASPGEQITAKQPKFKIKKTLLTVGKLVSGSAAPPEAWPGLDDAQGAGSRQASSLRGLVGR